MLKQVVFKNWFEYEINSPHFLKKNLTNVKKNHIIVQKKALFTKKSLKINFVRKTKIFGFR